jgi:uncharacterized protein (DUF2147 family)
MKVVLAALALLAAGSARAADPNAVEGIWWTQNHDGVVQIYPCETGLCGRVVGIAAFKPDGSPPLDLHGRSRCRLEIIPDGKIDSGGMWDSHITDPDDDKTYTIRLQVDPDGRLRMRGYIGLPILGRTVFWTHFTQRLTADCHILD